MLVSDSENALTAASTISAHAGRKTCQSQDQLPSDPPALAYSVPCMNEVHTVGGIAWQQPDLVDGFGSTLQRQQQMKAMPPNIAYFPGTPVKWHWHSYR